MKMKKLSKVLTLTIALCLMAVSLTACGGSNNQSNTSNKPNEPIALSEVFSEEGIWFYYDYADMDKTITKDDYVRGGILQFDGKVTQLIMSSIMWTIILHSLT